MRRLLVVSHHPLSSRAGVIRSVRTIFFGDRAASAGVDAELVHTSDARAVERAARELASAATPPWLLFNGIYSLASRGARALIRLNQKVQAPQIVYWHEAAWHVRRFLAGSSRGGMLRLLRLHALGRSLGSPWTYHLAVTAQVKQLVMLVLGAEPERVVVVGNATASGGGVAAPRPPADELRVAGAGSPPSRLKGVDLFAAISRRCRSLAGRPARYTWFGGVIEDVEPGVRGTVEAAVAAGAMQMGGFVEPLGAVLATQDLFLFTSRNDSFGFVALDALACDLPVFAFDSSGMAEVLPEELVCFDVDDMVERVESYLASPTARPPGTFSALGRRFGEERFLHRWRHLLRVVESTHGAVRGCA